MKSIVSSMVVVHKGIFASFLTVAMSGAGKLGQVFLLVHTAVHAQSDI